LFERSQAPAYPACEYSGSPDRHPAGACVEACKLASEGAHPAAEGSVGRRVDQNDTCDPIVYAGRGQAIVGTGAEAEENGRHLPALRLQKIQGSAGVRNGALPKSQRPRKVATVTNSGKVDTQTAVAHPGEQVGQYYVKSVWPDPVQYAGIQEYYVWQRTFR
jgi:hypothetical protein